MMLTFKIVHGVKIGRPSLLTVTAEKHGRSIVRVAGCSVLMMQGTFTI